MSPSLRTLLAAGLATAALLPPALAQDDPPSGPPVVRPDEETSWRLRSERDLRLGFTPRSAGHALAALESGELVGENLAATLYTLGVTGSVTARQSLRLWATDGESEVRQGAVLGLGELAVQVRGGVELIDSLVDDPDPAVAECALLALLQASPVLGRARAQVLVGRSEPLSEAAPRLLAWSDGTATRGSAALDRRFDLRWNAARRYGTIDDKAWVVVVLDQLARQETFLEDLVLYEVAELPLAGVRDHLVELLIAQQTTARARAVVRALPVELDAMFGAEAWAPDSLEIWDALLDEAVETGVAALMPRMLERAAADETTAPRAIALLARTNREYEEHVLRGLRSRDAEVRAAVARGIGDARLTRLLPQLEGLEEDRSIRVRSDALAARIRLGDGGARATVRSLFAVADDDRAAERARSVMLDSLYAAARGKLVLDFIESLEGDAADARDRGLLLATLQLRGRTIDTSPLRALLAGDDFGGQDSLRMLEAIGRLPDQDDLDFLSRTFPVDGNRRANLVLARALARSGHERVESLLQAATWHGPWNRCVLAAALVKERYGMNLLYHWAEKPPASATAEDVRRLGFAIGEWGTMQAVDELARRLGVVAGADRPVLQGALLGALTARTQ